MLWTWQVVSHWRRLVSLPRDSDEMSPRRVGCLLPCGALRVYAALKDARPCFDAAVRVRGFANLLVISGDSVDGLELWAVMLVKDVLCDRNVKVLGSCDTPRYTTIDSLAPTLTNMMRPRASILVQFPLLDGDWRCRSTGEQSLFRVWGTLICAGMGSSVFSSNLHSLVRRSSTKPLRH